MQIAGREVIAEAEKEHPEWKASLQIWIRIVSEARWRHFADVRLTFKNADQVGRFTIFNIAQNRARLASVINYPAQRVLVTEILAHARYDRKDFR